MVLDAALLSTQHYKVMVIKCKVDKFKERSCALPNTSLWYLLKRESSGHLRLRSSTLFTLDSSGIQKSAWLWYQLLLSGYSSKDWTVCRCLTSVILLEVMLLACIECKFWFLLLFAKVWGCLRYQLLLSDFCYYLLRFEAVYATNSY